MYKRNWNEIEHVVQICLDEIYIYILYCVAEEIFDESQDSDC